MATAVAAHAPVVPLRRFPAWTLPTAPPTATPAPPLTWALGVDRTADWHTHSHLGRGRATPPAVADAARAAGLRTWALTDHVTAEDTWIVEYAAMVRSIERDGVTVRCGVETSVLDVRGALDLPGRLPFLDHAVVTVADLPTRAGRAAPVAPADVVDVVVTATVNAVRHCPARPVVGRLFSVLPLLGVTDVDAAVGEDHLQAIARACRAAGGAVEVNERWRAPSAGIATRLAAAGVQLVAGSDATTPSAVGAWRWVRDLTGAACAEVGDLLALDDLVPPRSRVTTTSSSGTKSCEFQVKWSHPASARTQNRRLRHG